MEMQSYREELRAKLALLMGTATICEEVLQVAAQAALDEQQEVNSLLSRAIEAVEEANFGVQAVLYAVRRQFRQGG